MTTLIWTIFEFVASPFAVLARALARARTRVIDRAALLLRGLDYENPEAGKRRFARSDAVWNVTVPLLTLFLVSLVVYGDALVYMLRFHALLDPHNQLGVHAPKNLVASAVAAWIGALGIWGAFAWDMTGATAGRLPYSNLPGRWWRRILGGIAVAGVLLCLFAAALFFVWGQAIVETGQRARGQAEVFAALYALITIGAMLVAAWSVAPGVIAAVALVLSGLGVSLAMGYLVLAIVVSALDAFAAVLTAAVEVAAGPGRAAFNALADRIGMSRLRLPGARRPVAPDVAWHFLPPAMQQGLAEQESEEESSMSDMLRTNFFAGRGPLATYCLPLAGPNALIQGKALLAPDRPLPRLDQGGVEDVSLTPELVARTFAAVATRDEAFDLLRKEWIERLLPQLGSITQFFWVEAMPLEDAAWTEVLLRELHGRQPGLGIAVITAMPEPDQRRASGCATEPMFSRLRADGVVNAVLYVDPLSPFAQRHGPKVQQQALMNVLGGILSAHAQDPSAPSGMEAMSRIGAGGDVALAFASRPTGAGKRSPFARAFHVQKGYGNLGDLITQTEAAASASAHDPDALAAAGTAVNYDQSGYYVATLPISARAGALHAVREELQRRIAANVSRYAVVTVAAAPGLRLPGLVGDYVTSVGILFNFCAPPIASARRNGRRAEKSAAR